MASCSNDDGPRTKSPYMKLEKSDPMMKMLTFSSNDVLDKVATRLPVVLI